jgi:CheY-like chemotaxis protein
LFTAFTQADESTSRRYGGTGLGLTISKRLAELLGGTLEVESRIEHGSRFTLWLPIAINGDFPSHPTPPRPLAAAPAPSVAPKDTARGRVLLVDDAADNRHLLMRLFQRSGICVEVAENGAIAVQRVLQSSPAPFDVVLMDIHMPEMDGYVATSLLREKGYTGTIIAVTACASEQDRAKCLAAGCDDHVAKPIDFDRLLAKVLEHVNPQGRTPPRADAEAVVPAAGGG